ncbi:hypothetical protein HK101_008152 [Irineochytrium annulatum]|nr:hypothetical protein HK101_008152 [Irineochytrium annulatum]
MSLNDGDSASVAGATDKPGWTSWFRRAKGASTPDVYHHQQHDDGMSDSGHVSGNDDDAGSTKGGGEKEEKRGRRWKLFGKKDKDREEKVLPDDRRPVTVPLPRWKALLGKEYGL